MKMIKKKHGVKHCTFCKGQTPAVFTTSGLASPREYACDNHKDKLAKSDDGYMSEADYQTWGRL